MMRYAVPVLALALALACSPESGDESNADEADASESDAGESDASDATDDTTGDTSGDTTGDTAGDTTSDTTSDTSGDTTSDPDCTGPQVGLPMAGAEQPATPTAPGSSWPHFELTDFQPNSCLFGETYSLESFKGRVTLLALMRSSCEICQGTMTYLEQMYVQLELEGYEVYFVAINQPGYESTQQEFIDRASFPLLQDTFEVQAWELLNQLEPLQGTDDLYIYTADGVLSSYFSYAADNPTIKLETEAGWNNVYDAILAAM